MIRFVKVVSLLAVLALLLVPAAAQDDQGEGGVVVQGTFGNGPDTFSPIYCTGTDCRDVVRFMYVGLVAADPVNQTYVAGEPGALASEMTLSEDNLTYTLTLRDDLMWTDGTPITIDDVMYAWDVVQNDANYPYPYYATDLIKDVVALDDHTLQVTMWEAACGSVGYLTALDPLPSHIFSQYPLEDLVNIDYNLNPDVTSGPFRFGEFRPSEITTVIGWDEYPDATLGYVNLDGIVQRVVADQTVQLEEFLADSGTINVVIGPPPERKSEIRAAGEAGTHQVYTYSPGSSWDYMAFNLADPNNPQPAMDENGNHIDQGIHPIFGDKLVRQAISHAVDIDSIIDGAVFGEGSRMAAQIVPGAWAVDPDLTPRPYDPDLAVEMLAEAGWVPGDDGTLVCQGCLYATQVDASFEGSPLQFSLITNAGNTRREAIGTIIQDELAQIGIIVDFQTVDFNALIDDTFGNQSFDAFILGWRAGFPNDPDTVQLFGASSDDPAAQGSNMTSFYNEEYYELERQALAVPGCDREARAEIYAQMQQIMYDEVPYMWLYVQDGMYAARSNVVGFDPYPDAPFWNIDEWAVIQE